MVQRFPIYSGSESAPDSVYAVDLWYQMENNSADSSGNARDATYAGSYTTSGAPQGSYWITSAYSADFTAPTFTQNDTITMFCRMRYDGTGSNSQMANWDYFGSAEGWTWQLDAPNGAVDFNKKVSSTIYYSRTANSVLSMNTTYSFAVVIRGQHTRFFIDGLLASSPDSVTIATQPSTSEPIVIADVLLGELDDFQFYNRAVPNDSILYLHEHPGYVLKYLPE